jgi:UDP-glucose 4-epimerase
VLVADNSLAKQILDWSPRHDLKAIISTAWNWHANSFPARRSFTKKEANQAV